MIDTTEKPEMDESTPDDDQSFAPSPRRAEKPKGPARFRRAPLVSIEGLDAYTRNRYEACLIAAARARQLNAKKVAMEERGMEEAQELKKLKMTSYALGELLGGKIEVIRPVEEEQ